MILKEKRDRRSHLLAEATKLLGNSTITAEQRTTIENHFTEARQLATDIALLEEAERGTSEERQREQAAEERARAGRPALPQPGDVTPANEQREATQAEIEQRDRQYRGAFNHYLRTRDDSQLRAMNSTQGPNGGYGIPVTTAASLEVAIAAFGGVLPYLDTMPTTTGEQINWPLNNDTTNMGRELGENVEATETDLVIGTAAITTGLFSTDSVLAPRTLIRDTRYDLVSRIVAALRERQARLMSRKVMLGSTTGTFDSLVNAATVGNTSAGPTDITLVDAAKLFGAVDAGYAANGKFVINRNTQIYMSIQRNGLGAPIFQLDADGLLTKLFGCDVVIDTNTPDIAAGSKPMIFGDLKKYIYRPVGEMEVLRLEERYATANQVAFLGWYSAGGKLIDAGTHPIQVLQQHA